MKLVDPVREQRLLEQCRRVDEGLAREVGGGVRLNDGGDGRLVRRLTMPAMMNVLRDTGGWDAPTEAREEYIRDNLRVSCGVVTDGRGARAGHNRYGRISFKARYGARGRVVEIEEGRAA